MWLEAQKKKWEQQKAQEAAAKQASEVNQEIKN